MPIRFSRTEKGQSLAELGLVLVLLLLIIGGIVDLGRMFYTSLALRDTAQEGVIYGVMHPTDLDNVRNRILQSASFPIDAAQIADIQIFCGGALTACADTSTTPPTPLPASCQGNSITVRVFYDYSFLMPLVWRQTYRLSTSVTDTILQSTETIEALKASGGTCFP